MKAILSFKMALITSLLLFLQVEATALAKDQPTLPRPGDKKETFVFIHSGPGLHSKAEEALLKKQFNNRGSVIYFWNEPSLQRPDISPYRPEYAYASLITSVEEFLTRVYNERGAVHIIAHGYGVHAARHLGHFFSRMIKTITVISPMLNLEAADKHFLDAALLDFLRCDEARARELQNLMLNLGPSFAGNKARAFKLAYKNQLLWKNFFKRSADFDRYNLFYQVPGQRIDQNAVIDVRTSMPQTSTPLLVSLPTYFVFGASDNLVKWEDEWPVDVVNFENADYIVLKDSAHFPHLEETSIFMDAMEQFTSR